MYFTNNCYISIIYISYIKYIQSLKNINKSSKEIPFEIELSIKLKLYGLIDELIPDTIGVADTLWQ